MSGVHTTRSAAHFLGVSEASVRRWSDSGLLPVRRMGRRQTRRFSEQDLVAFRDSALSLRSRTSNPSSGLLAGAVWLPLHSHLATFYDTDDGRMRLSLPFLRDGLNAGEPCFLVASGQTRDAYVEALSKQQGASLERAIGKELFSILPGIGPHGRKALDAWEQLWWRAMGRGATALRVVGEMESERKMFATDGEMIDYEFAFNAIAPRFPVVMLCQYDVREFDGGTILGALKAHPDLAGPLLGQALL